MIIHLNLYKAFEPKYQPLLASDPGFQFSKF